ncbi:hypothetical protein KEM52_004558 [Ascosphaera acerosa]|nr:hypothetical protein KEM52_004558 [Ascosphaera acerosa]
MATPSASPCKRIKTEDDDGEGSDYGTSTACSPTKKHARAGSSSPTKRQAKASSLADAPEETRLLFRMREEGAAWPDIHREWERVTGATIARGTLQKRFQRLQASFACVRDEDECQSSDRRPRTAALRDAAQVPRLIAANNAVNEEIDRIQRERCARIAKAIAQAGGENYPTATIQKKMKEMGGELAACAR